jgi:hypothetical protein
MIPTTEGGVGINHIKVRATMFTEVVEEVETELIISQDKDLLLIHNQRSICLIIKLVMIFLKSMLMTPISGWQSKCLCKNLIKLLRVLRNLLIKPLIWLIAANKNSNRNLV